jgi:hypothetical protein
MLNKLKILTILDLAKEEKNLSFDNLYTVLDITDPFELDSLIIEAFGLGFISGKVDQLKKTLKVLAYFKLGFDNQGKGLYSGHNSD